MSTRAISPNLDGLGDKGRENCTPRPRWGLWLALAIRHCASRHLACLRARRFERERFPVLEECDSFIWRLAGCARIVGHLTEGFP
jgi:hypothetical protein